MPAEPLTVNEDRRRRQAELCERCHGSAPDCYRAIAEWWRIEAESSADPRDCYEYARNQDRLADDMEARPNYYRNKPPEKTDFEWSEA